MGTTVLGANGRLGGMLARHAARAGLGWQLQRRTGPDGLLWSGDFADPATDRIFTEGSTIINMIGYTGADETALDAINVRFVKDLLHHAANRGVAHVVLASSAGVYGAGDGTPFHETDALAPLSPYGASKTAMEDIAHAQSDGPRITILRIGNVAGADALLAAARGFVAQDRPMTLHRFANGHAARRSYMGPQDLAEAIAALAQQDNGPFTTLNVAHPDPVFLDDLLAGYRTHLLPTLTWEDAPAPDAVPASVVLNVDALQTLFPMVATQDPADAFARQVAQDTPT